MPSAVLLRVQRIGFSAETSSQPDGGDLRPDRNETFLLRDLVGLTPLPLTCREPPFAEGAADEVRWARGASAPGQPNGPRTGAAACSAATNT
jgi:hypothetical protein